MRSRTWFSETLDPPPILYTLPGCPCSAAATFAATMSATNVKSRVCSPSPYTVIGAPCCDSGEEALEPHVGPLSRPVHREIPQRHDGDAMIGPVQMAQVLRGQLGHAVRRQGLQIRVFTHGQGHVVAVHGRARRVHVFLDRQADHGFEEPLGGLDVVPGIDVEIASPALPDAGLCSQMEHMRDPGQKRLQVHGLQGRLDERESAPTSNSVRGWLP